MSRCTCESFSCTGDKYAVCKQTDEDKVKAKARRKEVKDLLNRQGRPDLIPDTFPDE